MKEFYDCPEKQKLNLPCSLASRSGHVIISSSYKIFEETTDLDMISTPDFKRMSADVVLVSSALENVGIGIDVALVNILPFIIPGGPVRHSDALLH